MTEAKKIATVAKSNPATIFFSEQRRVEQPVCETDGADRIWRNAISTTRGVDGNAQSITPASTPVAANINARPDPHLERRRERLRRAFPDADIDGSESKTRSR